MSKGLYELLKTDKLAPALSDMEQRVVMYNQGGKRLSPWLL